MQEKSFLIIGHTGFIGQKLLEKIKKEKKQLFLISRKISKKKFKNEFKYDVFNNYGWFKYLKNNMTIFFLAYNNDLYNLEKNKNYISKINKFCIHFNEYIIKKKN